MNEQQEREAFANKFPYMEGKYYFETGEDNSFPKGLVDYWLSRISAAVQDERAKTRELLDELAFESDNGYKIELFLNWDQAKEMLKNREIINKRE